MNKGFSIGNTFDAGTITASHAKKVWRRIEEQLPGGYKIVNASTVAVDHIVRSGMAVAYSTAMGADARDIVAIPWADIISAQDVTYTKVANPTGNPKTKGYYEYNSTTHEYSATNDTSVTDNKDYYEQVAAVTTDGLNIIGFLQEDTYVTDENTVATGSVVVKGEIYGYMLGDTVTNATTIKAALKAMTQKNGMAIRIID